MNQLSLNFNSSGAAEGGRRGDVVVIIDVLDMTTCAELVLEAGALTVFGASPTGCKSAVNLNPERMGYLAGKKALKHKASLKVITEPSSDSEEERRKKTEATLLGIARSGAEVDQIILNFGREIISKSDFKDKVVLFVSENGGTAFDAAFNNGAPAVLTATLANTNLKKGIEPALAGARRAIEAASKLNCGITITVANIHSQLDLLAGQFLSQLIINNGFFELNQTH